jgi:hypothetical protein
MAFRLPLNMIGIKKIQGGALEVRVVFVALMVISHSCDENVISV